MFSAQMFVVAKKEERVDTDSCKDAKATDYPVQYRATREVTLYFTGP